jgi:hypothetical protein
MDAILAEPRTGGRTPEDGESRAKVERKTKDKRKLGSDWNKIDRCHQSKCFLAIAILEPSDIK